MKSITHHVRTTATSKLDKCRITKAQKSLFRSPLTRTEKEKAAVSKSNANGNVCDVEHSCFDGQLVLFDACARAIDILSLSGHSDHTAVKKKPVGDIVIHISIWTSSRVSTICFSSTGVVCLVNEFRRRNRRRESPQKKPAQKQKDQGQGNHTGKY